MKPRHVHNAAGIEGRALANTDGLAAGGGRALRLQPHSCRMRGAWSMSRHGGYLSSQTLALHQRPRLWVGRLPLFSQRASRNYVRAIEAGACAPRWRSLPATCVSHWSVNIYRLARSPTTCRIRDAWSYACSASSSRRHLRCLCWGLRHHSQQFSPPRWEAANIRVRTARLNRPPSRAARSAFESAKQRFFGHLLTSI